MSVQFKNGGVYSFDLWPANILGSSYKNVTVLGVISERLAIRANLPTRELHAQVYSQLPVGTPNDAGAYDYVEFLTTSGESVILGLPWIKEDSVQEVVLQNYNVKVGSITASDLNRLRNTLLTGGFNNFEITLAT